MPRIFDFFDWASRTGIEVKVGYLGMDPDIQSQIFRASQLMQSGTINAVEYHLLENPETGAVGVANSVLQLINNAGMSVTIHF